MLKVNLQLAIDQCNKTITFLNLCISTNTSIGKQMLIFIMFKLNYIGPINGEFSF
jgi:hypothetical protein